MRTYSIFDADVERLKGRVSVKVKLQPQFRKWSWVLNCRYAFKVVVMVTWLHLRTHHLWRTIKEVGLLSEDHLPQSMTQPVQPLNQTIHLHPNTSHLAHYTISAIEGVATPALPFSSCFCPPSSPSHIPLIPPFPPSLSYPPTQRLWPPTGEALFPGSLAGPLYIFSCLAFQVSCRAWIACLCNL